MKPNTKGIYISANPDAFPRIVTVSSNDDIYALTKWDYFDIVRLGKNETDDEADMFVDDVGRLNGSPVNLTASCLCIEMRGEGITIHGDVIVFGHDGNGETIDAPEWVFDWIRGHEIMLALTAKHKKKESTNEG